MIALLLDETRIILNVLLSLISRHLSYKIVVSELDFSFGPNPGIAVAESHIINDLAHIFVFVKAI
mgnify:CR=1 FL=1